MNTLTNEQLDQARNNYRLEQKIKLDAETETLLNTYNTIMGEKVTVTTHILIAKNMVEYWSKERSNNLRNETALAIVDSQIKKYEDQIEHLSDVRADMIMKRLSA